ncbi:MAG: TIGR01212 family radical SAM protein [Lentisphaeria bacterium]|nr:TIGR01212 family radical SAM protein [Lentisphaeria bacterium]
MKQILTLKTYFQRKYGAPLQRIPLDPGFPCPNRRPDGSGGCAFCPGDGSRAQHLKPGMPLAEQVRSGIAFAKARYGAKPPYAAYFQAYTTTNGPVDQLREMYREVLAMADFPCVIVATRPDCLPPQVIDLLAELTQKHEVWVELGVQTANDATLQTINRGHDFAAVERVVPLLAERGIKVAAHVILGLPGETMEDYRRTAEKLAKLPLSGIKTHNLLIYRDTPMEKLFKAGKLKPLNEYEYAEALAEFLRILPEELVVMRLCADAPDDGLAVRNWWMEKGAFTDMFLKMYESGNTAPDCMKAVRTADGSYTFYHPKYRQHFHSVAGAREESVKKYLEPCLVEKMLRDGKTVDVLDVGFGMGWNVHAAVELAEKIRCGTLRITSMELDRTAIDNALRLPGREDDPVIRALAETGKYESGFAAAEILCGDARQTIQTLEQNFDAIFLDAFTPDTNPELWTTEFIAQLKNHLKEHGRIASYCSAYPVRGALIENGFTVLESEAFGRKRGGTVASLIPADDLTPLPEKEFMITTKSTAGTPYRDAGLSCSRDEILQRHTDEIKARRAAGIPKWYRP